MRAKILAGAFGKNSLFVFNLEN